MHTCILIHLSQCVKLIQYCIETIDKNKHSYGRLYLGEGSPFASLNYIDILPGAGPNASNICGTDLCE